MTPAARIGVLFIALAVIFLGAAYMGSRRSEGRTSPARRTWLRIAIIFAIVGLGLQFLHLVTGP